MKDKFEHVEGTGHLGELELCHMSPDESMREEISEAANKAIFGNPDLLGKLDRDHIQLINAEGRELTQEEIEEIASHYQDGRKQRR